MPLLFVYGSLKAGFPNAHHNTGRRIGGGFNTAEAYPLMLLRGVLPCLVLTPGRGLAVHGEVYDVTPDNLADMDRFERVGEPGGYRRQTIAVVRSGDPLLGPPDTPALSVQVYGQDATVLDQPGQHVGPLNVYTLEHAQRLRW
jgi:gamma-glutamylaminecyclotransferase